MPLLPLPNARRQLHSRFNISIDAATSLPYDRRREPARRTVHHRTLAPRIHALMHPAPKLLLALTLLAISTCLAAAQSTNARLAAISTRAFCQTHDAVLVHEFIAQGTGSGSFVSRGLGPSLIGVSDALQDPIITLFNARGDQIDFNNNWKQNPHRQEIIDVGLAPGSPREAAIIDTLGSGIYTLVEQGANHGEGVALPEIYDLADDELKISAAGTRAFVSTESDVLISGIIIIGSDPLPLLVRALGPSLADARLTDPLQDPTLELISGDGDIIASNDNWKDTQEAEIEVTGLAPSDDREAAIVITVDPGLYTAIVAGAGGTTGLGFVQFYSLAEPIRELNPAPIIKRRR